MFSTSTAKEADMSVTFARRIVAWKHRLSNSIIKLWCLWEGQCSCEYFTTWRRPRQPGCDPIIISQSLSYVLTALLASDGVASTSYSASCLKGQDPPNTGSPKDTARYLFMSGPDFHELHVINCTHNFFQALSWMINNSYRQPRFGSQWQKLPEEASGWLHSHKHSVMRSSLTFHIHLRSKRRYTSSSKELKSEAASIRL